ncbi:hypothetical protein [Mycoplasma todarodis]|uniref:Uncharacterized protein n=1 Tax=Mycoplasma todarodis TaxID=1937191 RepID=A0A4R0XQH7_9MOLU|nr:hypothetical protein [Mycoplasma todarodis]TCG11836.1 hypothetical protein C4B25_00765 [Mycoplasma todarodis]
MTAIIHSDNKNVFVFFVIILFISGLLLICHPGENKNILIPLFISLMISATLYELYFNFNFKKIPSYVSARISTPIIWSSPMILFLSLIPFFDKFNTKFNSNKITQIINLSIVALIPIIFVPTAFKLDHKKDMFNFNPNISTNYEFMSNKQISFIENNTNSNDKIYSDLATFNLKNVNSIIDPLFVPNKHGLKVVGREWFFYGNMYDNAQWVISSGRKQQAYYWYYSLDRVLDNEKLFTEYVLDANKLFISNKTYISMIKKSTFFKKYYHLNKEDETMNIYEKNKKI